MLSIFKNKLKTKRLKIDKKLRTISLNSNFTDFYRKKKKNVHGNNLRHKLVQTKKIAVFSSN